MYTVSLPIRIKTGKKQPFSLNLNAYRNAHYFQLNEAKAGFETVVRPLITHIPHLDAIKIVYTVYWENKRSIDVANVCSIVDKFFCDTLTNKGILNDDDSSIIPRVEYCFGGIDKENPRVEAFIIPL